jgi:hypothetical protein
MAILRITRRQAAPEVYDAVAADIDLDKQHPLGLLMHGASEVDGGMQIAQIWDSEEYARRFDAEVLEPALRAAGAPLDAEVVIFELRHLLTP